MRETFNPKRVQQQHQARQSHKLYQQRSHSSSCFYSENNISENDEDGDGSSFISSKQETPDLKPHKLKFKHVQREPSIFDPDQSDSQIQLTKHLIQVQNMTIDQREKVYFEQQNPINKQGLKTEYYYDNNQLTFMGSQNLSHYDQKPEDYVITQKNQASSMVETQESINKQQYSDYNQTRANSHVPPNFNPKYHKIINESIISQTQQTSSGQSNNQTRNQSSSIMIDSLSLIQKNRANILNASNNQSIRDTIISSSQNQESINVLNNISNSQKNTAHVSEVPTEYKSISDIHEVLEIQETSFDSSNERRQIVKNSRRPEQSFRISITPCIKNEIQSHSSLKVIGRQSVKSVRKTPQFKGMGSVQQIHSTKNSSAKKPLIGMQRYCETQEDSVNSKLQESISQTSLQPAYLNTTGVAHELLIRSSNTPLVITSKDRPNVYRIIGRESSKDPQSMKQSYRGAEQKLSATPKQQTFQNKPLIDLNYNGRQSTGVKNLKHQLDEYQQKNQLFQTQNVRYGKNLNLNQANYDANNRIFGGGFMTANQSPKSFFEGSYNQNIYDNNTSLRLKTLDQQKQDFQEKLRAKQNLIFQPQYQQCGFNNDDEQQFQRLNTDSIYHQQQYKLNLQKANYIKSNIPAPKKLVPLPNLKPEFINQNDLNEGIIYTQGGIGYQQRHINKHAVRFEDQSEDFSDQNMQKNVNLRARKSNKNDVSLQLQQQIYFQTDPQSMINPRTKSKLLDEITQREKYLRALKQMQLGNGYEEPDISDHENDHQDEPDHENQNDHYQPPQIFLTQERDSNSSGLMSRSQTFEKQQQSKQRQTTSNKSSSQSKRKQSLNYGKNIESKKQLDNLNEDSRCIIM
ncbi:UNKNOWN [Stylonychia lemnae]|uniref:Uncharacterized protein n=1 Tax=Stylonychia lemnae TaxID=5949 RepID=A0A078AS15_STYLE|nr:UNKNOWN [Stylonychia lemnae]|eukprot:CDW85275.1 UNKNOWN [Stylonychia lemnae]